MNKKAILLFLALLCCLTPAMASTEPPDPFFDPPSYIDVDYVPPEYSSVSYSYDPDSLVRKIVQEYELQKESVQEKTPEEKKLIEESKNSKDYETYLRGAEKFNKGDYEESLPFFTTLTKPQSLLKRASNWIGRDKGYSWPREAATYMVARTKLAISQRAWDGYDAEPEKIVDQKILKEADAAYETYLEQYPDGLYADSARNVKRRIFMLSGQKSALDIALKQAVNENLSTHSPTAQKPKIHTELLDEFFRFYDKEIDVERDAPLLVLYAWLGKQSPKESDIQVIEARQKEFETIPDLFRYTHALGLYRLRQYQKLLDAIPENRVLKGTFSMSTQLLRARSLKETGKNQEALDALEKLNEASHEDSTELEIARLKIEDQDALWLYSKESPLTREKVLRAVAQNALDDSQIENGIKDKRITEKKHQFLLEELMLRYLLSQKFEKLNTLFQQEKNAHFFEPLRSHIRDVVKNSNDTHALLAIAKFEYQQALTPEYTFQGDNFYSPLVGDEFLPWCPNCKKPEDRRKSYFPPITLFKTVADLESLTLKRNNTEAENFHYLVKCFKGYEFRSRCTWGQPFENKAKYWFKKLHLLYSGSFWAKKTPYYYSDP
jgi:hypothetical protein